MENRLFKLSQIAQGDDNEAKKTVVYTSDSTTAAVWVVKPNQFIPTHKHTTSDDLWICIQGAGVAYPEKDKEVNFSKGDMLLSEKDTQHGLKNTGSEDLILVSVIAPFPSDFVGLE